VRFAREDFERNKGVEDIVSLFSVAGWRRVILQLDCILYCVTALYSTRLNSYVSRTVEQ